MKQGSINIIRNIFYSCSKWTTAQQCRGSCWYFRDWCCCCWRIVLFVFFFVEQNGVFLWTSHSHLQVVKRCRWKRSTNARSENSVYIQLIIFPVEFNVVQTADTWYPLVSKPSCAPTIESTSSLISCVPCWLGVNGTRARWLFKNCCLWDNNKLQASRGATWELIVNSCTKLCSFRVTETGPKSRDHSISSLETEIIILL